VSSLYFTLLSEGSSDRALLPVLSWSLRQHSSRVFQRQWADLRRLPRPPRTLEEKVRISLDLYPCNLLFVHRDGDRVGRPHRVEEIKRSLRNAPNQPAAVCVVPVRTLEAWFLCDEKAIRMAAGKPAGKAPLSLPPRERIEKIADPKKTLREALEQAAELTGRRRRRSSPGQVPDP
jgi:hypothetical protein